MNTEAHIMLGYFLAHASRDQSRGFRALVTLAAVLPDIDTAAYVFGEDAYATYHHAVGHNMFFFVAASVAMAWWYARGMAARNLTANVTVSTRGIWLKILLFTQVALWTHYLGDYFFTRFPLQLFWPIPHKPYIWSHKIGLDHPINNALSYLSFVSFAITGWLWGRTPIEFVSVNLDQRIINLFRRKPLVCHVCGRRANERCTQCQGPVCVKHGRIGKRFEVFCSGERHAESTMVVGEHKGDSGPAA